MFFVIQDLITRRGHKFSLRKRGPRDELRRQVLKLKMKHEDKTERRIVEILIQLTAGDADNNTRVMRYMGIILYVLLWYLIQIFLRSK